MANKSSLRNLIIEIPRLERRVVELTLKGYQDIRGYMYLSEKGVAEVHGFQGPLISSEVKVEKGLIHRLDSSLMKYFRKNVSQSEEYENKLSYISPENECSYSLSFSSEQGPPKGTITIIRNLAEIMKENYPPSAQEAYICKPRKLTKMQLLSLGFDSNIKGMQ